MSSSRRSRSRRLKRYLANAFVVFLGVVTLLLLVGLFLPRTFRVERQVEIAAKPEAIYPLVADLHHWPEWTVWNKEMDPAVEFSYEGPDVGVGAAYRWNGPKMGRGSLRLVRADSPKAVGYEMEFNNGEMLATGSLQLEPVGQSTRVTWLTEGDLGKNPVNRYVGLMLDRTLGTQFEGSLHKLKQAAESKSH